MTYALTFDNSWAVMSEDEMHDVNGGFFGWSGRKFLHNLGVLAGLIALAVFGVVMKTGAAFHIVLGTILCNIGKGTASTAKAIYGVLTASWGWTLGIAAAGLLLGVGVLGYVTL